MNAIVLAGGKSTRFLSSSVPNKAFLQIGDRTIIELIISSLYTVFDRIWVVAGEKCIPFIERQLSRNNLKVIDFFNNINLKTVPEKTVRIFDPELLAFINVNNREEYRRALEINSGVLNTTMEA